VTTFYGYQRVLYNARVKEEREEGNTVVLSWVLPDDKQVTGRGRGKSLKAARKEANRHILEQLPEPKEAQKLIPIWRKVLDTTRQQLNAEVRADEQRPEEGKHIIEWMIDDGSPTARGGGGRTLKGTGKAKDRFLAELEALEQISLAAEHTRRELSAPREEKARAAQDAAWAADVLTAHEITYYLTLKNHVVSRMRIQSTESTLPQGDKEYVSTLEWRFFEPSVPTKTYVTTGVGKSKMMSRALAAKHMLEDRGMVLSITREDREQAHAIRTMCLNVGTTCVNDDFDVRMANRVMQTVAPNAHPLFLVELWRTAILKACTDSLVLPKSMDADVWTEMLDESTFVMEADALSALRHVQVGGEFENEKTKAYYCTFRYLIASERRAQFRQAMEGRLGNEDNAKSELEYFDMNVAHQTTPFISLVPPSSVMPTEFVVGDILLISTPDVRRPLLGRVTSKNEGSEPRLTLRLLRKENPVSDASTVKIANLDAEITALRQIEALDGFAGPVGRRKLGKESRFNFDPELREIILNLDENPTAALGRLELVHGPPGTGKTYTACELVKQWLSVEDARPKILCTTDSNAAADNLYEALINARVRALRYRATPTEQCENAPSYERWKETQDPYVRMKIWQEMFENYPVIVSTCSSSGQALFDKFSFDALIVDEATQTSEPSLLIGLGHGVRQAVLIGDPKQLPPCVFETPELKTTLFHRLDETQPDKAKLFLSEQRRMHRDIMDFPNKFFYDGRLVALVDPDPVPGWPGTNRVIFRQIESEENSLKSSKFNKGEIIAVVEEVRRLYNADPTLSIAVLTPYLAQKQMLKRALLGYEHVAVNTIDGYQGNEADVVLFSTVRSQYLGFVNDAQRANVALTRAKRGLIVFGRRECLNQSPLWTEWVKWVESHTIKAKE